MRALARKLLLAATIAGAPALAEAQGSLLFFDLYTSSAANPAGQDTLVVIRNTHPTDEVAVHLFFVAGNGSIADAYVLLAAQGGQSFQAAHVDPGVTGFIVGIATDAAGCPINHNFLTGESRVHLATGHAGVLPAHAVAAIADPPAACAVTATLQMDGVAYARIPQTLRLPDLASRADGNDTLVVLNRIAGDLTSGVSSLGTVAGNVLDDGAPPNAFPFTRAGNPAQLFLPLDDSFPATTPSFTAVIPTGHGGALDGVTLSPTAGGIFGSALNRNPGTAVSAPTFIGGRNLESTAQAATASLVIPVFPTASGGGSDPCVTTETTPPAIDASSLPGSVLANVGGPVPDVTGLVRTASSDACTPRAFLEVTQNPLPATAVASPPGVIVVTVTDVAGNSASYTFAIATPVPTLTGAALIVLALVLALAGIGSVIGKSPRRT